MPKPWRSMASASRNCFRPHTLVPRKVAPQQSLAPLQHAEIWITHQRCDEAWCILALDRLGIGLRQQNPPTSSKMQRKCLGNLSSHHPNQIGDPQILRRSRKKGHKYQTLVYQNRRRKETLAGQRTLCRWASNEAKGIARVQFAKRQSPLDERRLSAVLE